MMIDYDEAVLSLAASFDCNTSTYSFGYVIKYGEHPMESYSHKDNKGEYAKEGAIAGLVSGISKGINRANWRNYYKITICHNSESADVPALEAKEANFYSIEETKQLLELLKQEPIKYQAMINIALFCGLRLGELANLEWKDIDFDNLTLNVSKQLQYLPAKGIYEAEYTKTKSGAREMSIPQILADL